MILLLLLFVGLLFTPLSVAQAILIMVPLFIFRNSIRKYREADESESYPDNDLPFGG